MEAANIPNPKPYRLVVATNFDDTSEYAMTAALSAVSRMAGAEIHLVTVVSDPHAGRGDRLLRDAEAMDAAHNSLKGAVIRANLHQSALADVTVHYHVRLGRPAAAILQLCADVEADLVVVGSHGRKGVERAVFGSVSRELLESGRVPVLVARPADYAGIERSARIEPAPDAAHPPSTPPDYVSSVERIRSQRPNVHVSGLI
jgi:nucleotide-binding universal stress UspA family protein